MARRIFAGNGMSPTSMMFKIATIAGHKLTVPELNKIKELNARRVETMYNEVVSMNDRDSARFALSWLLPSSS